MENLKVQRDSAENMVHKLSEENEKFAEEVTIILYSGADGS